MNGSIHISLTKSYHMLEYSFLKGVETEYIRETREMLRTFIHAYSRMKVFINDEWMLKGR